MAENRKGNRHKPGYVDRYNAEMYDNIRIRVRKDSGIRDALWKVAESGQSVNGYVLSATEAKLIADGYMPKK